MKCHIPFHRKLKFILPNYNFKQITQIYSISVTIVYLNHSAIPSSLFREKYIFEYYVNTTHFFQADDISVSASI